MSTSPKLPLYQSHKKVHALEIQTIERRNETMDYNLTFREAGYPPIQVPAPVFARYTPVPGDFYVVYADGYVSVSPRHAFLEGYTKVT